MGNRPIFPRIIANSGAVAIGRSKTGGKVETTQFKIRISRIRTCRITKHNFKSIFALRRRIPCRIKKSPVKRYIYGACIAWIGYDTSIYRTFVSDTRRISNRNIGTLRRRVTFLPEPLITLADHLPCKIIRAGGRRRLYIGKYKCDRPASCNIGITGNGIRNQPPIILAVIKMAPNCRKRRNGGINRTKFIFIACTGRRLGCTPDIWPNIFHLNSRIEYSTGFNRGRNIDKNALGSVARITHCAARVDFNRTGACTSHPIYFTRGNLDGRGTRRTKRVRKAPGRFRNIVRNSSTCPSAPVIASSRIGTLPYEFAGICSFDIHCKITPFIHELRAINCCSINVPPVG